MRAPAGAGTGQHRGGGDTRSPAAGRARRRSWRGRTEVFYERQRCIPTDDPCTSSRSLWTISSPPLLRLRRPPSFGHLRAPQRRDRPGGTAVRLVAQVMCEPCVTRRPSYPRRGSPSFEYPQASSPPRDPSPIYLPWQGRAAAQFRRIFFLSHDAARFFPQRSASGS